MNKKECGLTERGQTNSSYTDSGSKDAAKGNAAYRNAAKRNDTLQYTVGETTNGGHLCEQVWPTAEMG